MTIDFADSMIKGSCTNCIGTNCIGTICIGTNCIGTNCIGNKLYREQTVSGTYCIGNKLYRVQFVSGTNCIGSLSFFYPFILFQMHITRLQPAPASENAYITRLQQLAGAGWSRAGAGLEPGWSRLEPAGAGWSQWLEPG